MLIERLAYANRWRRVSPAAKGLFALAGFAAAFAAPSPGRALGVALALATVTFLGAGIAPGRYFRAAWPALLFLAAGSLSLVFSLDFGPDTPLVHPNATGFRQAMSVGARSLAALSALLFLVTTTPLTDLIALLRRLKTPETLLEIMVLCYRTLFVFSAALQAILTAQSARLGYATPRLALHSLGGLAANLAVDVWRRAALLQMAAQARGNDGPLRFLAPRFEGARRHTALAAAAGSALFVLAIV